MKFDLARRKFLKILLSPFSWLGAIGAYVSVKFALSGRENTEVVKYNISTSPIRQGEVKDLGKVFLVRDKDGIFAMLAKCTHLGCKPMWNGKIFHCPCHGSEFTEEGDVIMGPARKHLINLLIKKKGNVLYIYLNKPAPYTQRIRV